MDFCSKYSQYKHHSGLGGVSGVMDDNPGNYYSHMHPLSFKYQTSLYRFNSSTGSSCNGIGPPTTIPISPTTNLYQNYDRYNTYSNLSPYAYNSYNNNLRSMNEYYNHCDNFNRIGIGSSNFVYHHNYRNPYDINIHNGTRGGSNTNDYNLYSHHSNLSDRDYYYYHEYQHSGYFSHSSNNLHYNHNNQSHFHQNYYHHHTPPPAPPPPPPINPYSHLYHSSHHFQLRNTTSKDSLTSRTYLDTHNKMKIAPNERDECKNVNSPNITTSSTSPISLSPVSTIFHSQLNCNDSCTSDTINNRSGTNIKNDNYSNNEEMLHEEQHQKDQPEQGQNQTTSNGTRNDSIEFSRKESKSRKSTTKDKDKSFSKQLAGTNRKVECSTPLNQSPILERPGTPFVSSSYSNNLSRTHNEFSSFNQTNSINNNNNCSNNCWSPFNTYELTNSPNNWSHHHQHHRHNNNNNSKLNKKRCNTPKSSSSSLSISSFITNKNRILECDFIPSKKSKKKIKSESSSDDCYEYRAEIKNITPLPGFQQAFGSTEIGRFSETFFSAIDSPIEPLYESEADTLSPQPWETGDSLDGPHYNLYIGASVQPMYSSENYTSSNDSPIDSNYFSEIQCSDY